MSESSGSGPESQAARFREGDVLETPALFEIFGEMARLVGRADFYERLAEITVAVLGCNRWMVVRYSRYGVPEFIVNRAMSEEALELYFQQLYRLDPLLRVARSGPATGVFCLRQLRASDHSNAYFDDLFRSAWIFDELTLMFAAPGRVSIALCFDRANRAFSDEEINRMETIFPLFEGLHESHLNSTFRSLDEPAIWHHGSVAQRCFQILDKNYHRVFATGSWFEAEERAVRPLTEMVHRNRDRGVVSLSRRRVLHWDRLPANFAPAPGGLICMIENRRQPEVPFGFDQAVDRFAKEHDLTPREQEIVVLVFRGYPNELISQRLGICSGTVRNHRHRLYYKLDITTERELFNMFISHLTTVIDG